MAYAGALFADACLRGLNGQKKVVECTYIETDVVDGVSYFSTKALLSREGRILLIHCPSKVMSRC